MIAGGIVCVGPRTISAVWQATGRAAPRHHDTASAVVRSAAWEWDDLGMILATLILTPLVPGGVVWVVVDDPLGHKRGAKVAFGGIFRDAVLASKRPKTLRFGLHWVVLGIAVPVPMRPDRSSCLPLRWRLDRTKGQAGYQTRPQAAATRAWPRAEANPDRTFWRVGDSVSVNAALVQGRPENLAVIGPLPWKAALADRPAPRQPKQKGASRTKGDRRPNPKARIEDTATDPAELWTIAFPKPTRPLSGPVLHAVLWSRGSKTEPVLVVLVRDPLGQGRHEAVVATDPTVSAPFLILGSCRRGSVELAFVDSKQHLGRHDPRLWSARSVERAQPMAWFIGSLTILWYCVNGHEGSQVVKDRPWYAAKVTPTSTDRLGTLRLQRWEYAVDGESDAEPPAPQCIQSLLHKLAAVA